MDERVAVVYKTKDLQKFKLLLNNREVTQKRVDRIIQSIKENGYIYSPMIVNEKYEVIDGQGRLQAAINLGLHVYYTIGKGMGIKECRAMNQTNSNWQLHDFIYSYSQDGIIDYINIKNLVKEFGNALGNSTIYAITAGSYKSKGGNYQAKIKSGELKFDNDAYEASRAKCQYLLSFKPIFDGIKECRKDNLYFAIMFMMNVDGCNRNILIKQIQKGQASLIPVTTIEQAIDMFEECYNFRSSKKIWFTEEYKKQKDSSKKESRAIYKEKTGK